MTGFVVDDAIVVIENITRHLEEGTPPMEAALEGFGGNRIYRALHERVTDCRIYSHSDDGWHRNGRLFREFAVVLERGCIHLAPGFSNHYPMMCARFLKANKKRRTITGRIA